MSQPRKIRCSVAAILDHGGRVFTVDLVPVLPLPAFRPGQFLHLTVDEYDPASFWPDSRVFSIASSPRERQRIRICYAVKGVYTAKMEQLLQVGGTVWVKLPYGEFLIDDTSGAVLIAGGTGISAFTAFLEALTPATPRSVTLLYGARTPDLWLFRDMIERQLATCPAFSAIFFAESGLCPSATSHLPTLRIHLGRISLDTLTSDLRPLTSVFYLSGPPVMLKAISTDLASRGIPAERIRTDAWE